jgi:hypothetical protein
MDWNSKIKKKNFINNFCLKIVKIIKKLIRTNSTDLKIIKF